MELILHNEKGELVRIPCATFIRNIEILKSYKDRSIGFYENKRKEYSAYTVFDYYDFKNDINSLISVTFKYELIEPITLGLPKVILDKIIQISERKKANLLIETFLEEIQKLIFRFLEIMQKCENAEMNVIVFGNKVEIKIGRSNAILFNIKVIECILEGLKEVESDLKE